MEIQGQIIEVLPLKEGTTQKGTSWKSQEYVIQTHEDYPRKCCFQVYGEEKINKFSIKKGEDLSVSFDIDAREYQGRWYNTIRAWKVERVSSNNTSEGLQEPLDSNFPFPNQTDSLPY